MEHIVAAGELKYAELLLFVDNLLLRAPYVRGIKISFSIWGSNDAEQISYAGGDHPEFNPHLRDKYYWGSHLWPIYKE